MKEVFFALVESALSGSDEDAKELAQDMCEVAFRYTKYRFDWNFMSNEERAKQDSFRTSAHNRTIDAINIFLRYMGKSTQVPDISDWGRKEYGDLANELVSFLAIRQR